MKYNKRVQNYLSAENSKGRYFKLKNGKLLYLKRFEGQEKRWSNDGTTGKDLKDVFEDLMTQAYEIGREVGEREAVEKFKENLSFLRSLL